MTNIESVINQKSMQKHPEGGYFIETYKSPDTVTFYKNGKEITRAAATGIEFLLKNDDQSHLHMLDIDEQWTFAGGTPILLQYIDKKGNWQTIKLGNPFEHNNVTATAYIPKNTWFCASLASNSPHKNQAGLVSCNCAPAFDFEESFKLATEEDKKELIKSHPHLKEKLEQFVLSN